MADFTYQAKDSKGESKTGEIQVPDQKMAAQILRKRGLVVISINQKNAPSENILNRFFNRVSFGEIVVMTRQLSTMVSSGIVLSEAIDILIEQQTNKTFKKALSEISADIKGGLTLAQAFGRQTDIFPKIYINLVRAGETSGKLDKVLVQMADGLEKQREFRAKIKGAMIYPAVVLTMMVFVVIIMMVFVIPKLLDLYTQSKIELPLPTKILIFISHFTLNFWWVVALLIFFGFWLFKKYNSTQEGSLLIGRTILKIPIVGKIVTNVTMTNFNRTFGLLTTAGIPILECISIAEDLSDNPVFKKVLKDAHIGVERGLPFSALLTASSFPRIIPQMVRVGEETGKVDEVFFKLAEYFESESDQLLKNLTVAIEPIILVFLGIGVAFLVISIILPIYKLTTSF